VEDSVDDSLIFLWWFIILMLVLVPSFPMIGILDTMNLYNTSILRIMDNDQFTGFVVFSL